MKVLITGSKGYVGSVLIQSLKEKEKFKIAEIDANWFSPENQVSNSQDVRIHNFESTLDSLDAIVYLAAVSNDPMGKNYEIVTNQINTEACIKLAKKAKISGTKRFIYASSCSIYGSATETARKETDKLNPLTAYARSKVEAEQRLKELADKNFQIKALRFATACGASPNLRLDLVLNDFVASAVLYRKIEVLSDGSPWRPLIHVKDMARAISWALECNDKNSFLSINIGSNDWTYQIKELANIVKDNISNTNLSINHNASPDKRSYKVDFSLFKEMAPNHQPKENIEKAIFDLRDQIQLLKFNNNISFRDSVPYIRLKTLERHIEKGNMNQQLYWSTK